MILNFLFIASRFLHASQRRSVYLSNQLENLLTNLVLKEHRTLHLGDNGLFSIMQSRNAANIFHDP